MPQRLNPPNPDQPTKASVDYECNFHAVREKADGTSTTLTRQRRFNARFVLAVSLLLIIVSAMFTPSGRELAVEILYRIVSPRKSKLSNPSD